MIKFIFIFPSCYLTFHTLQNPSQAPKFPHLFPPPLLSKITALGGDGEQGRDGGKKEDCEHFYVKMHSFSPVLIPLLSQWQNCIIKSLHVY